MRAGTRPSFTLSSMKAVARGPAAYGPTETVAHVPVDIMPLPVARQSGNRVPKRKRPQPRKAATSV